MKKTLSNRLVCILLLVALATGGMVAFISSPASATWGGIGAGNPMGYGTFDDFDANVNGHPPVNNSLGAYTVVPSSSVSYVSENFDNDAKGSTPSEPWYTPSGNAKVTDVKNHSAPHSLRAPSLYQLGAMLSMVLVDNTTTINGISTISWAENNQHVSGSFFWVYGSKLLLTLVSSAGNYYWTNGSSYAYDNVTYYPENTWLTFNLTVNTTTSKYTFDCGGHQYGWYSFKTPASRFSKFGFSTASWSTYLYYVDDVSLIMGGGNAVHATNSQHYSGALSITGGPTGTFAIEPDRAFLNMTQMSFWYYIDRPDWGGVANASQSFFTIQDEDLDYSVFLMFDVNVYGTQIVYAWNGSGWVDTTLFFSCYLWSRLFIDINWQNQTYRVKEYDGTWWTSPWLVFDDLAANSAHHISWGECGFISSGLKDFYVDDLWMDSPPRVISSTCPMTTAANSTQLYAGNTFTFSIDDFEHDNLYNVWLYLRDKTAGAGPLTPPPYQVNATTPHTYVFPKPANGVFSMAAGHEYQWRLLLKETHVGSTTEYYPDPTYGSSIHSDYLAYDTYGSRSWFNFTSTYTAPADARLWYPVDCYYGWNQTTSITSWTKDWLLADGQHHRGDVLFYVNYSHYYDVVAEVNFADPSVAWGMNGTPSLWYQFNSTSPSIYAASGKVPFPAPITSPTYGTPQYFYDSSMHHQIGKHWFTIPGEDCIPFFSNHSYTLSIRVYAANGSIVAFEQYFIAYGQYPGSVHTATSMTMGLCGFDPEEANYSDYSAVGQGVIYRTINTKGAASTAPAYHIYLVDLIDPTHYICEWHNDKAWMAGNGWGDQVPFIYNGKQTCFQTIQHWSSVLQVNHDYAFYIGFYQGTWTQNGAGGTTRMNIETMYDDSIQHLNFSVGTGSDTRINDSNGLSVDYWGIKINFGTNTGTAAGLGSSTGSTWGPTLGTQIDHAFGISGASIIAGILVIAAFAFLPIIITHTVPPLPILVMFAGMGMVLSFGMGFFPLWLFFVVCIIVALIIVYRIKGWIMTAWGGGGDVIGPGSHEASGVKQTGTAQKIGRWVADKTKKGGYRWGK